VARGDLGAELFNEASGAGDHDGMGTGRQPQRQRSGTRGSPSTVTWAPEGCDESTRMRR